MRDVAKKDTKRREGVAGGELAVRGLMLMLGVSC